MTGRNEAIQPSQALMRTSAISARDFRTCRARGLAEAIRDGDENELARPASLFWSACPPGSA